MTKLLSKKLTVFVILLALIFVLMYVGNLIQTDFGRVTIEPITIEITDMGVITGRLYKPESASKEAAPAVLMMHGYQNDKDTSAPTAIELARRGYVVLTIDEYGHGSSTIGMIERGYVNHTVRANFGDDKAGETLVPLSGPSRIKIMLNFSNQTFFYDYFSKDSDGNSITDSSMGGIAAYATLASFDFVDETRMAVGGHSMGTWASWSVAAAYTPDASYEIPGVVNDIDISPKAIILQCGELFTDKAYDSQSIRFNNVLLLQAKYDEFAMFRDYENVVTDDLIKSPLRSSFLGVPSAQAQWNNTFGSFSDGTARRIELLATNHRLAMRNRRGMATTIDWLDKATGHSSLIQSNNHHYQYKGAAVFTSMLLAVTAMLVLMDLLLLLPFFRPVVQPELIRSDKIKDSRSWWKGAVTIVVISGLSYPFMSQLGHGLLPLPENIFRMTIGNGFLAWYLLLIVTMLLTTIIPFVRSKKTTSHIDYYDLGFAESEKPEKFSMSLLAKSSLLALCMTGFVYLLVYVCQKLFQLDFRLIWPFFKTFNVTRFLQFLVYIPFFSLFFVLNNSRIFAGMKQVISQEKGFKATFIYWLKNAFCMAGGVLLVCLIEYIPFFMGIGPGADLLFGSSFGGPFMSLLLVFFPQITVISTLCTYIYKKTGQVFVSGLTASILSTWIITGGSAILIF